MQHVDPAECQHASIDYRSNVIRVGRISSDRLADAAFRLGNPLGLERGIEIDIGGEDSGPSRAKSTAVALPLPQPGPLDSAPETNAALSVSRSPMLSSYGGRGSLARR